MAIKKLEKFNLNDRSEKRLFFVKKTIGRRFGFALTILAAVTGLNQHFLFSKYHEKESIQNLIYCGRVKSNFAHYLYHFFDFKIFYQLNF